MQDLINSFQLDSLVNQPTRITANLKGGATSTAIDYVVSNIKNISLEILDPGVSDHLAQVLKWKIPTIQKNNLGNLQMRQRRNINNHTITEFKTLFSKESPKFKSEENLDIDVLFDRFWTDFEWCFKLSHPLKTSRTRSNNTNKFIFSNDLRHESNQLRELNWYRKLSNDNAVHENYKSLKKQLNKKIETEKKLYYNSIISEAENKPKKLWELVNIKLNRKKIQSSKINLAINGNSLTDSNQIANEFGKHFVNSVAEQVQSLFSQSTTNCTLQDLNNCTMFFKPFIEEDIKKIISQLKNKFSVGLDEVPIRLIKECNNELSPYLTDIINKSVTSGKFPSRLKIAKTTPIFKKGDPESIENYRAIVTLSPFSKIIEKAVYIRLTEFLTKHDLLTNCQHGFRSGHSTETATTELIQHILSDIDKGNTVVGVFFDLSRAFDTLDSVFLAQKLHNMGIRGNINDWIISYTTQRQLVVKIENSTSDYFDVNLGTPQGSVLGPLLFLLYVNDLPNHIHEGRVFMYADDTTVLVSGKTKEELTNKLNVITKQFTEWCIANHLIINLNKTVYVEFTGMYKKSLNLLGGPDQKISKSTKFLGSFLDGSISWNEQINHVCAKLNSFFFALKTLKNTLHENLLVNFYYGSVYPIISNNIIVWGQATEHSRVFIIQKRIIRLIFSLTQIESCREIFITKKLLTTTGIYILKLLTFIHHNSETYKKHADIHTYSTRNKNNIYIEKFHHTFYKKSPYYAGYKYYNILPAELKNIKSITTFKYKVKEILLKNCFYDLKEFEEYLCSDRVQT